LPRSRRDEDGHINAQRRKSADESCSTPRRGLGSNDPWPQDLPADFAVIFDRYSRRLVRWVAAIFGVRDAEDIAQDALLRLYVHRAVFAEGADPWPWLAVVARNVGRDLARRRAFTTVTDSEALDRVASGVLTDDEALARDDAERLVRALRRLSSQDRVLLRLRELEGVGVADLALMLGKNQNAVRQQLFRARNRLAAAYVALGGSRSDVPDVRRGRTASPG
jgi:RNA polymerase sigma-70 factor (ECF subfamily)